MSAAPDLDSDDGARGVRQPQIFNRVFVTPAGAPWEQARAAQLEARHGSPLPISELSWRLKRLGSWAPGRPARFAVFYVRTRELAGPYEATVEIEGVAVRVAFGSSADQLRRMGPVAAVVAIGLATGAMLSIGLISAWNTRLRAESRLSSLERSLEVKARRVAVLRKHMAQARELQTALGRAAPLSAATADLGWAAASKTPDARIAAIHWDHGLLAVESRGANPPLIANGRRLERSKAPLRPGVWLWGVRPTASPGDGPEDDAP